MERPGTLARAGFGAAGGAWKYYIRPEITAKRSWAAIAGLVLAHEVFCPQGELLSEGGDRLIEKHPVLGKAAILGFGLTATLHVANSLPEKADPFKRGLDLLR